MRIHVFENADALSVGAASHIAAAAHAAIEARGVFNIALSGGTTPRQTYERLATEPYSSEIDWSHVHVFWGDERCVPPDHPDSDFGMAKRALLDHVSISGANVHRMRGELDAKDAAAQYESEISAHFASSDPKFDLILLGLGEDGHTASLFPRTSALYEESRLVIENYVRDLEAWRVTFTFRLINTAEQVVFLAAGSKKADIVSKVIDEKLPEYPASHVDPITGELHWLLDASAAIKLKSR
jgi:6-phosphogluconolactonase